MEKVDKKGAIDGVAIIGVLKRKKRPDCYVIVKRYRPSLGKHCVELPTGPLNQSETVEEGGMRNLRELTGYVGKLIVRQSYDIVSDPGLSNVNMALIQIEIDGGMPSNQNPKHQLPEDERVEVVLVEKKKLLTTLNSLKEQGYAIESKLYGLAYCIEYRVHLLK